MSRLSTFTFNGKLRKFQQRSCTLFYKKVKYAVKPAKTASQMTGGNFNLTER